jgi:hypothetical protein
MPDNTKTVKHFAKQLNALPQRWGEQKDQTAGPAQGRVEGEDGHRRRFTALPRAIQQDLPIFGQEQFLLPRIGLNSPPAQNKTRIKGKCQDFVDIHE